ncbi:terminase gpA endonuclease subunit [Dyella sp.]|uniref:terminase gpA endonuclease subunit n=1 Tax=Dyella sp. TaxID=1869338 RepID=UPI0028453720|nr:terminase gpA endonuclease subunit [Dyella sp.]MDR3445746.1 phage terminase large subunit family protein [Dyella sp.]
MKRADEAVAQRDEAMGMLSDLIVMRRLGIEAPGPGYSHFPVDRDLDYFKQLTAERLTTRYVKGQPVREWVIGDHVRNEALDCRVYAFAALKIMQPSFRRLSDKLTPAGYKRPATPAATPANEQTDMAKKQAPRKQVPGCSRRRDTGRYPEANGGTGSALPADFWQWWDLRLLGDYQRARHALVLQA